MTLPVAILAGGLATRLGELTSSLPKSLIEVAGKPFIEHQLLRLREQGYRDVVLCVGHLGEMISAVVGDGHRWGMSVAWSFDGDQPAGTGGALRRALPLLGESFLVLYGDSYLTFDFEPFERAHVDGKMPGAVTVLQNDDRWDRSNILFAGGRIERYGKGDRRSGMRHVDAGLLAFRSRAWAASPEGPFDLGELLTALAARGELVGFEVTERFHEIGSVSGLNETRRFLSARKEKR